MPRKVESGAGTTKYNITCGARIKIAIELGLGAGFAKLYG
jgi:hypothetical protein